MYGRKKCLHYFQKYFCPSVEDRPKTHIDHPKILSGNINLTSYEGETVSLPCEISNLGDHPVIWMKIEKDIPLTLIVGYQQFSRNMRYRVVHTTDEKETNKIESWNFEIRKVAQEDGGLYECFIKVNAKHKIKATIYLDVLDEKGNCWLLEISTRLEPGFLFQIFCYI